MLVTLLASRRNKDNNTREPEFLLQPMPVCVFTFIKSLASQLRWSHIHFKGLFGVQHVPTLGSLLLSINEGQSQTFAVHLIMIPLL